MRRIGYLAAPPAPTAGTLSTGALALVDGLLELGWVEGENLTTEYRYADFHDERLPGLAAELADLGVEVIVATTTTAALAARGTNATIPVVMPTMLDPVGSGLVESLAHPGGTVTGLSFLGSVLSGKRLGLLKELVPRIVTVAVLWNAGNIGSASDFHQTETAGADLGLQIRSMGVRTGEDFDEAYKQLTRERPDALLVLPENLMGAYRSSMIEFAAANQLPAMYGQRFYVAEGGLIAYGPDSDDLYRRAAAYVDKLLKGARAADLPVEQPTKFELTINQKTARTLGLAIPQSVLLQATEILQ